MSSAGESGSLLPSTCNSLTTMTTDPGIPATNGGGKVKRTRNRQRLSCVECTKRRQVGTSLFSGLILRTRLGNA